MRTTDEIAAEIDERIRIFAVKVCVEENIVQKMNCSVAAFTLAQFKQFVLEQPNTRPILPEVLEPSFWAKTTRGNS